MKYLIIILLFASCSPKIVPEVTIPQPEPIHNVRPIYYPEPESDKVLNEHTFTMLVDKITTIITTTIAILLVDETNP